MIKIKSLVLMTHLSVAELCCITTAALVSLLFEGSSFNCPSNPLLILPQSQSGATTQSILVTSLFLLCPLFLGCNSIDI